MRYALLALLIGCHDDGHGRVDTSLIVECGNGVYVYNRACPAMAAEPGSAATAASTRR